jgi:hypothetical protein
MQRGAASPQEARQRLVEWLRHVVAAEKALGDRDIKRELREIQKAVEALAQRIEHGPAAFELEVARFELGFDAPLPALLALRDSVIRAREPRRSRQALHHAATAYLHLLYREGRPRPRKYELAPETLEFAQLLEAAGAPRSTETAKGLLTQAMESFDPLSMPPGLERLLR